MPLWSCSALGRHKGRFVYAFAARELLTHDAFSVSACDVKCVHWDPAGCLLLIACSWLVPQARRVLCPLGLLLVHALMVWIEYPPVACVGSAVATYVTRRGADTSISISYGPNRIIPLLSLVCLSRVTVCSGCLDNREGYSWTRGRGQESSECHFQHTFLYPASSRLPEEASFMANRKLHCMWRLSEC